MPSRAQPFPEELICSERAIRFQFAHKITQATRSSRYDSISSSSVSGQLNRQFGSMSFIDFRHNLFQLMGHAVLLSQ